ncbi:chitin synthase [Fistulina hepatica ATCC 64428]|uniref:Chitin synthase n=1 Tax=Fistulina hepatica ATCC 64428 TaxID=1128425 RepID=A0A0D7A8S1_9AGAR|nr:chitin synthase [Fistulina hepatica ATCC 64428]
MAYRQQDSFNVDNYYYSNQGGNTGAVPDYPPSSYHSNEGQYDTNWETKSAQSYETPLYASSQAHLNPSQVTDISYNDPPPLPNMPYAFAPNYPPAGQQRPGMWHQTSSAGYSVAREKLLNRRAVKQVELVHGNLVLDMQVPSHIVPANKEGVEEFTHMRYTAATCDPDDFLRSRYSLRQYLWGRQTELFIVMTMYNEDEVLFTKTMNAVLKNVAHLCGRTRSKTWGPEGWKKVVVCVVSDGRSKVNKRTLHVLSLMGVYQDGIAKDSVGGKDVTAHIFEYTSSVVVSASGEVSHGPCPVQILFCLKEQNKKKLNSHRWFFNAFGPLIKPNVCILLDVGTKPTGTSIYELWKVFDKQANIGGACGEICVDTGRACSLLLTSPLAASQNFEYKMSNILDKPLESVFGYISVLPGAFSAYRYTALQNGLDGTGPLASYFKGESMHGGNSTAGIFERNMYLAEDRILCFEIVTKKREGWILRYVKSAKASTDTPTTVPEFISQRRRWLNGSLFASIHAAVFWWRIWSSGQNIIRKFVLQIEFIYNAIQLVFAWTQLANFYLAFYFLIESATESTSSDAFEWMSSGAGSTIFEVLLKVYIALIFVVLVCSLGNRPQGSKWTYAVAMIMFGFCNMITLYCAAYTVWLAVPHTVSGWEDFGSLLKSNATFRDIVISLAATYGLYFIASFMHFEPWHMFTSFFQYLFLLPSCESSFSFCNIHDVTWGTKGDNGAAKDLGGAKKVKGDDGKEMFEVEVPSKREDVDQLWSAARSALRMKAPEEKEHRDAATKQADRDRNSRTNIVLAWIGTNMVMIVVFTSSAFLKWVQKYASATDDGTFNPYLTFLFWSMAGISAVRFTGSALYLLFRLFGH